MLSLGNSTESDSGYAYTVGTSKRLFFFFGCAVSSFKGFLVRGGYPSLQCMGFSLQWLLVAEHRLQGEGFSNCGTQALVAPWHMQSSQTRDRTHVPCITRQVLILCTTPGKSESKLFLERTVGAHTSETGQITSEQ